MYKYTVDGLAAREEADAAASSEAAASASTAPSGSGDAADGGNATSRDGKEASMSAPLTSAPATSASAEPTTPREPPNAKQYQYTLKGIVVHSGSAFAGHYYSYIKVCQQNSVSLLSALDKMESIRDSCGLRTICNASSHRPFWTRHLEATYPSVFTRRQRADEY